MKNRFNQNHQLMLGCAYFFLVNGSAVLMTNALLVFLIRDYHLSYDQGGFLLTIQAAGNIVMSFLSGPISLRIGNKRTLLFSAVGFAASLLIIAIRPPLIMLQLALFLSGLAWGICNNLINYLVVCATDGNSRFISLIHAMFSMGAFLSPLLVSFTVRLQISWRWAVVILLIFAIGLLLYTLFMPIPEMKKESIKKGPASLHFLRSWHLYLYMLMLFLYVGIETGFSGWLVTYLTVQRGIETSLAQALLSGLWIAMICGRVGVSVFGHSVRKTSFLLIEAVGICFASLFLILSHNLTLLSVAVFFLGLSMSAFYGMVISNAGWLVAKTSVASGLMVASGGLGASLMPLICGMIAENRGVLHGLWFLFGTSVLLFFLCVLNLKKPHLEQF